MGVRIEVTLILCASIIMLSQAGCVVSGITAMPGPVYGISGTGVAVAGDEAGGPCLTAPVCLITP